MDDSHIWENLAFFLAQTWLGSFEKMAVIKHCLTSTVIKTVTNDCQTYIIIFEAAFYNSFQKYSSKKVLKKVFQNSVQK